MKVIVLGLLYIWTAVFGAFIVWLTLYYMGVRIYPLGIGEDAEQEVTEESKSIF